jgi:uncharacterized protein YegP (UPF0339 family)
MLTRRNTLSLIALLVLGGLNYAAQKKMTFEIYPDSKGEFWWRLKDSDGANIATSGQGYSKKADCTNMVDNFKSDISKYNFEVYEDNAKKYRFRMKSKNAQTVGSSSKGYDKKADVETAVDSIKKGAKDADKKEVAKEK